MFGFLTKKPKTKKNKEFQSESFNDNYRVITSLHTYLKIIVKNDSIFSKEYYKLTDDNGVKCIDLTLEVFHKIDAIYQYSIKNNPYYLEPVFSKYVGYLSILKKVPKKDYFRQYAKDLTKLTLIEDIINPIFYDFAKLIEIKAIDKEIEIEELVHTINLEKKAWIKHGEELLDQNKEKDLKILKSELKAMKVYNKQAETNLTLNSKFEKLTLEDIEKLEPSDSRFINQNLNDIMKMRDMHNLNYSPQNYRSGIECTNSFIESYTKLSDEIRYMEEHKDFYLKLQLLKNTHPLAISMVAYLLPNDIFNRDDISEQTFLMLSKKYLMSQEFEKILYSVLLYLPEKHLPIVNMSFDKFQKMDKEIYIPYLYNFFYTYFKTADNFKGVSYKKDNDYALKYLAIITTYHFYSQSEFSRYNDVINGIYFYYPSQISRADMEIIRIRNKEDLSIEEFIAKTSSVFKVKAEIHYALEHLLKLDIECMGKCLAKNLKYFTTYYDADYDSYNVRLSDICGLSDEEFKGLVPYYKFEAI